MHTYIYQRRRYAKKWRKITDDTGTVTFEHKKLTLQTHTHIHIVFIHTHTYIYIYIYIYSCMHISAEAVRKEWRKITDDTGRVTFENEELRLQTNVSPQQYLYRCARYAFERKKWSKCKVCMCVCVCVCMYMYRQMCHRSSTCIDARDMHM